MKFMTNVYFFRLLTGNKSFYNIVNERKVVVLAAAAALCLLILSISILIENLINPLLLSQLHFPNTEYILGTL